MNGWINQGTNIPVYQWKNHWRTWLGKNQSRWLTNYMDGVIVSITLAILANNNIPMYLVWRRF